jgi:hypothetical protein
MIALFTGVVAFVFLFPEGSRRDFGLRVDELQAVGRV